MTSSYFNAKADIWDEKIAEKDTNKLENMAQQLDIHAASTVLDVGAGTGVFIPFLLKRIGDKGKLICLDQAEKMLEKARQKNFPGNIEFVCSDITSTGFGNEVFDSVVCYSSFPHFHNKFRSLNEIRRVLKKGSRLFICHTSSRSVINKIHRQVPELASDLIPDNEEMLHLLSSSGFGNIEIQDNADSYLVKAEKSKL
jgi:ubiquinone/menaquinone biosynthesis C-methylase UbiE